MEFEIIFVILAVFILLIFAFKKLFGGDYLDEQLRAIKKGDIQAQPIMNRSEIRLYSILASWQQKHSAQALQLFSQVSMGEILSAEEEATRRSFNSKRLDFLFVDKNGFPKIAIEYQGEGHYGSDRKQRKQIEKRDRVKKHALEKAGVQIIEIFPADREQDITQKLNAFHNL